MPRNTLITFLGRVPKSESGYRAMCYDLGDRSEMKKLLNNLFDVLQTEDV